MVENICYRRWFFLALEIQFWLVPRDFCEVSSLEKYGCQFWMLWSFNVYGLLMFIVHLLPGMQPQMISYNSYNPLNARNRKLGWILDLFMNLGTMRMFLWIGDPKITRVAVLFFDKGKSLVKRGVPTVRTPIVPSYSFISLLNHCPNLHRVAKCKFIFPLLGVFVGTILGTCCCILVKPCWAKRPWPPKRPRKMAQNTAISRISQVETKMSHVETCWSRLLPCWGRLGVKLGPCWAILGLCFHHLEAYWRQDRFIERGGGELHPSWPWKVSATSILASDCAAVNTVFYNGLGVEFYAWTRQRPTRPQPCPNIAQHGIHMAKHGPPWPQHSPNKTDFAQSPKLSSHVLLFWLCRNWWIRLIMI